MAEPTRLDAFSKILLATQTINYLANNVNAVIQDIKTIAFRDQIHAVQLENSFTAKEMYLSGIVDDLVEIMNDLGDFCNGGDMVMPVDEKATENAFRILNEDDSAEQDGYRPNSDEEDTKMP
ncbi:MAG: hypothetical protein V4714_17735 [Bacteroidota bacterium]